MPEAGVGYQALSLAIHLHFGNQYWGLLAWETRGMVPVSVLQKTLQSLGLNFLSYKIRKLNFLSAKVFLGPAFSDILS